MDKLRNGKQEEVILITRPAEPDKLMYFMFPIAFMVAHLIVTIIQYPNMADFFASQEIKSVWKGVVR